MAFFGTRSVADESSLLGSLRVAVVGEPFVGKTALTELIANGRPAKGSLRSTAGAHIYVKLVDRAQHQQDPSNEAQRRFFVELWDVSGQQKYEQLRSVFYKQLNGEQSQQPFLIIPVMHPFEPIVTRGKTDEWKTF